MWASANKKYDRESVFEEIKKDMEMRNKDFTEEERLYQIFRNKLIDDINLVKEMCVNDWSGNWERKELPRDGGYFDQRYKEMKWINKIISIINSEKPDKKKGGGSSGKRNRS